MAGIGDDEDDSGGESEIASRGLKSLRERLEEGDDSERVSVQEPEEQEEELDETPQESPRKQKRRERANGYQSARERAAAAEATAALLREQLEAERSRPRQYQEREQQGSLTSDIDAQIRRNYQAQEALHDEYQSALRAAGRDGLSREKEQSFKDRAIELDVEKTTLVADRREALRAPQRENERKLNEIRSAHPDVFRNPNAVRFAQAKWNELIARGEPDTKETVDLAFQEAREVILGQRPAPDRATRQRTTGMGGARAVSGAESRAEIRMPQGQVYDRLARAAFPNLEPAQARQKWANTVGRKLLAEQKQRG